MVRLRLAIILFLILGIFTVGCVGNGDISTAIEKWNKIADKTQQIRILEEQFVKTVKVDNVVIESEVVKEKPNFDKLISILDKWKKTLDEEKMLLEEESSLISDFAGSTINLDGDAKIYGDSILKNIRESHRYATSSLDNYYRAIESLRLYYKTSDPSDDRYYRQYEQYFNAADSDTTKSGLYVDKTNDDMKKLEALQ